MSRMHSLRSGSARLALLGLALTLAPSIALAQTAPDGLVVFGDSLSDAGNVWKLSSQASKAPYEPVPTWPYAIGGHHYSNGKTWVEQMAGDLGLAPCARPAMAGPARFCNYAFGGGRARAVPGAFTPGSALQIGMYLQSTGGSAAPDELYVLAFGGNDVRDALIEAATNPAGAMAIVTEAAAALIADIQQLYAAGARRFLVANAPNISLAPAVQASGGAAAAEFFATTLNGMLEDGLLALEADPAYADIDLRRLDMYFVLSDMVANPASYGLVDPVTPCLSFFVKAGAKCDDADEHLFWDGIHPTSQAHRGLADVALSALGGS